MHARLQHGPSSAFLLMAETVYYVTNLCIDKKSDVSTF